MPLTFIDIERRKSWRIAVFFVVLLFLYFAVTAALVLSFLPDPRLIHPSFWAFAFLASLLVAGIHFWFSAHDAVGRVVRSLDAQPPDLKDDVHRMFSNIIQELHVVTGNRKKIRSVVIPSLSLNALAAADLRGEAVIGITEGLLSRLSRSQVEAVAAHEAHHVLSGDCLEATVAASLFGTYSAIVEKIGRASRGRSYGSPAVLLAWALLKLSHLLNMLISREREYRADAASVRMTRNPLALAEALHLLSRSWRGAGFIGSGLEMLCIVNPRASALDEAEGFLPDLLSTHPPLGKRMDVLLRMARVNVSELERKAEQKEKAAQTATRQVAGPRYYAMSPEQEWQGPFSLAELAALPWLSPLSWITTGDERSVDRAWKDPALNAVFASRFAQTERMQSVFACPACRQPLAVTPCEGTRVHQCRFCAGVLAENDKIPRIIARRGRPWSDRVNALARAVLKENHIRQVQRKRVLGAGLPAQRGNQAGPSGDPLSCPKCRNPMSRGFYSQAHLVEVDRCSFCGLTWFDRDELDMLQCIIENRLVPEMSGPAAP